MPVHALPELRLPRPDHRAVLDRMPGSTVPVIRQPFAAGDPLPFWARRQGPATNHLYDVETDPDELENRAGEPVEAEMLELLHHALAQLDAPSDQYERLALR
jgi:hypothetical protein